jgi:hypothetical protein
MHCWTRWYFCCYIYIYIYFVTGLMWMLYSPRLNVPKCPYYLSFQYTSAWGISKTSLGVSVTSPPLPHITLHQFPFEFSYKYTTQWLILQNPNFLPVSRSGWAPLFSNIFYFLIFFLMNLSSQILLAEGWANFFDE